MFTRLAPRATGDYDTAARYLGHRAGEANALNRLGTVRPLIGDHRDAAKIAQEALDIFCNIGERQGQAEALNELRQAHPIYQRIGTAEALVMHAVLMSGSGGPGP